MVREDRQAFDLLFDCAGLGRDAPCEEAEVVFLSVQLRYRSPQNSLILNETTFRRKVFKVCGLFFFFLINKY